MECATPDQRGLILAIIDRLREHGDTLPAIALWQRLQYKGGSRETRGGLITAISLAHFCRQGFDWHANDFDGVLRTHSMAGLEIEFFGKRT